MTARYADRQLYLETNANALRQADTWKTSDPAGAALMRTLATFPDAHWMGDWSDDPRGEVDGLLTAAKDGLCVFVVYNIPDRDYGSDSGGGAADAADYTTWVHAFASGLEGREAIVILEPDALAMGEEAIDDGRRTSAQVAERHAMMKTAVDLITLAGGRVYVDAGDSDWISAPRMAAALRATGAQHFATNVSHFEFLKDEHGYADELRTEMGTDAHYVVDCSRNGTGPHGTGDARWRNPPDVGCGHRPTLKTRKKGCDALLWVKSVGGSDGDGAHDGAPPAGQWWPEFARRLCAAAVPPFKA